MPLPKCPSASARSISNSRTLASSLIFLLAGGLDLGYDLRCQLPFVAYRDPTALVPPSLSGPKTPP